MIPLLRLALILTWIFTQLLGLLAGGWGLLGAQMGQPGSAALGVLLILAPTVLAGGGLWLAARRADLAALALGAPLVLLLAGFALLLGAIGSGRGVGAAQWPAGAWSTRGKSPLSYNPWSALHASRSLSPSTHPTSRRRATLRGR